MAELVDHYKDNPIIETSGTVIHLEEVSVKMYKAYTFMTMMPISIIISVMIIIAVIKFIIQYVYSNSNPPLRKNRHFYNLNFLGIFDHRLDILK